MFMYVVYFLVFLFSCLLGAIVGLGGGVIIRPVLDAIGYHNVMNIAFFTSSAIIIMSVVSTSQKKAKGGANIQISTAVLISLGALVGGALGDLLLQFLIGLFRYESTMQMIQAITNIIVLTSAIYFTSSERFRFELKAKWLYPVLGLLLGAVAMLLGIAGGPVNVPVFMVLFSMSAKNAAAYSIVVIFFAHLLRLVNMGITPGFASFDLSFLLATLPAAAIGGAAGAMISRKMTDKSVTKAFNITMVGLVGLNIFNIVTFMG